MRKKKKNLGFTLIEIIMVVVLVGILATMTLTYVGDNQDAVNYELTQKKMEVIRKAILGTDAVDSSGHRTDFGYHGDFGHLPVHLDSLTSSHTPAWSFNATYGMGCGWICPGENRSIESGRCPVRRHARENY